jgi:hypothetical protein
MHMSAYLPYYSCQVSPHPSLSHHPISVWVSLQHSCAFLFDLVWQYHSNLWPTYVKCQISQEKRKKLSMYSLCTIFLILVVSFVMAAVTVASFLCLPINWHVECTSLRITQLADFYPKVFVFLCYTLFEHDPVFVQHDDFSLLHLKLMHFAKCVVLKWPWNKKEIILVLRFWWLEFNIKHQLLGIIELLLLVFISPSLRSSNHGFEH